MCGKTVAPESTRTQYDIVAYLNYPVGNGYDTINGCKYAAMNKKDFTAGKFESRILVNWLYKNEAVVALCINKDDVDAIGHALLVNGTLFYDGSGNCGWLPQLAVHSV